jgi:bifunctional ADP-heptose synthase (sugar kinase/adenylyltransferase)
LKPDVLVKGGDWKTSEIIGSDFVLQNRWGGALAAVERRLFDEFANRQNKKR